MYSPKILIAHTIPDYELLDSGEGEKLERYGEVVLSRPDPQALWRKNFPEKEWAKADGQFSRQGKNGSWKLKSDTPQKWQIRFGELGFWIKPTAFKHTGLFPEQESNWRWIQETIRESKRPPVSVINLFGYTGGATLAAAHEGAAVCHVDGSKAAISWAKSNAELSGLAGAPIRWILDDVRKFVEREIKRGKHYDAIIMDPPAFGHGNDKEVWKIESDFLPLMDLCIELLSPDPLFFLINGYASGYSAVAYHTNLSTLTERFGGTVESGELTLQEKDAQRLLPCGIFARWKK